MKDECNSWGLAGGHFYLPKSNVQESGQSRHWPKFVKIWPQIGKVQVQRMFGQGVAASVKDKKLASQGVRGVWPLPHLSNEYFDKFVAVAGGTY